MKSRQQYLLEQVSALLRSRGLRVSHREPSEGGACADLVIRNGDMDLVVQCKALNLYRSADFRAAIGDAILRFQHEKRPAIPPQRRLLLAFLLQRMSRKALDDLREYALAYLPDLQWIVVAEDGSGAVHVGGVDEHVSLPPPPSRARREHGPGQPSLFSPNNQWLFKVLLLSGMDSRYWGGPARKPESIGELAHVAGVPQPSVSAFVNRAEQEGFLKRDPKGFVIRNHHELLDDWGHALKSSARYAIGLRFVYPNESEDKFLHKLRSYLQAQKAGADAVRVAIGGHMGCHLLSLGRSNARQARLYADGPSDELLSALDLLEAPADAGQLSLVVQPRGDAVFRAAVNVNGLHVCDALQCYFDVRFSYARGKEQADYLYEQVLRPHFEGRG